MRSSAGQVRPIPRETNAELAERLKLPLVSVLMPGNALFWPGTRLRRRFMTTLAALSAPRRRPRSPL